MRTFRERLKIVRIQMVQLIDSKKRAAFKARLPFTGYYAPERATL